MEKIEIEVQLDDPPDLAAGGTIERNLASVGTWKVTAAPSTRLRNDGAVVLVLYGPDAGHSKRRMTALKE